MAVVSSTQAVVTQEATTAVRKFPSTHFKSTVSQHESRRELDFSGLQGHSPAVTTLCAEPML